MKLYNDRRMCVHCAMCAETVIGYFSWWRNIFNRSPYFCTLYLHHWSSSYTFRSLWFVPAVNRNEAWTSVNISLSISRNVKRNYHSRSLIGFPISRDRFTPEVKKQEQKTIIEKFLFWAHDRVGTYMNAL